MTVTVKQPEPLWTMPLHGLPCDHCWEPARGLVVYERTRFVLHVNPRLNPCGGINPPPPAPPVESYPKRKEPLVKRKVGRPKTKK